MPKIIDPDLLNQGTEVNFLTGSNRLIQLNTAGNLDATGVALDNGVSMQALYSFCKEEWKNDNNLIKFPFPILAITAEQFELINGWDLSGSFSKYLIRDAGWALKDDNGDSVEEWMNITTLGAFVTSSDQAYYVQTGSTDAIPQTFQLSGEVNQGVLIYASQSLDFPSPAFFDARDYFSVYLREQGKIYGFYDLIQEQNIGALTNRKFALPLSNAVDLKITVADVGIDANSDGTADVAPYTGMSITWFAAPQARLIGGISYNFSIIIDGNNATAEQIYEFVQWSLRQEVDIDAGAGVRRGDIAEELLQFIGDTLRTKFTSAGGVFIDNFNTTDTNRLEFTDNTGTIRTFPFVAAGNILFNDNLQSDTDAIYKVFFTNDDAGDNSGRDFGTDSAIIINQFTGLAPLTGSVGGSGSVTFDYDYDNNIQRGVASSGSNAPFTAVALGLSTAQYTVTVGNIVRSTANVINFVAALERNYLNPI